MIIWKGFPNLALKLLRPCGTKTRPIGGEYHGKENVDPETAKPPKDETSTKNGSRCRGSHCPSWARAAGHHYQDSSDPS